MEGERKKERKKELERARKGRIVGSCDINARGCTALAFYGFF